MKSEYTRQNLMLRYYEPLQSFPVLPSLGEGLLNRLHGRTFDDLLMETIEDVLKQVFGKNAAKTILQNVKNDFSLNGDEVSKEVQVFSDALQKIIGPSGGIIIQDLILETLYSKLELELKRKINYEFSDYIKELRSKFG